MWHVNTILKIKDQVELLNFAVQFVAIQNADCKLQPIEGVSAAKIVKTTGDVFAIWCFLIL